MDKYEGLFNIVLKYREIEMQKDNTDHYMVYNALGRHMK